MTRFTPRPLGPLLMLSAALALSAHAQAAVFKDPAMQQALEADQDEELLALARARLKTDATDPQGLAATALVGMQDADAAKLEAHALSLQQCVERHPRAAVCHFVLGQVLGSQAMSGGMMKAMTLTGRIKESFQKALALEPQSYEARDALQQFYLMAPGIAGGSTSKARALADEVRESQPEQAQLLRARLLHNDGDTAGAEREIKAFTPGRDVALNKAWVQAWLALGLSYLQDKQPGKARAWLEPLTKTQPQSAYGFFGLARVAAAEQRWDESARAFEQARGLEGARALPIDYRLGLMLQTKGDKAQAKAALERYLAGKSPSRRLAEDARRRLAELG